MEFTKDDSSILQTPKFTSEYEKIRAQNIERNNARLRSLGLISALEEKKSNIVAWGSPYEEIPNNDDDAVVENDQLSQKRKKRKQSSIVVTEGSRKSLRLQGIGVENKKIPSLPKIHEEIKKEREARVKECRETRLIAARKVAVAGAEAAAKENPTATYEHCLMRVKTMTDKALANRIKAIERAAGRHCVVKMAIFKSCLQDEGMWELADLSSEALERLKALKAPPE